MRKHFIFAYFASYFNPLPSLMKKIIPLLLLSVLVLSCKKDDPDPPLDPIAQFALNEDAITLASTDTSLKVPVVANIDWTYSVVENPSWIRHSLGEGGIVFTLDQNSGFESRSAKIRMSAEILYGELKGTFLQDEFTVRQLGKGVAIDLEEAEYWLHYYETSATFTVNAGANWELDYNADWIEFDVTSGAAGEFEIAATLLVNDQNPTRSATFTVSTDEHSVTRTIVQRGQKTHSDVTHYLYIHYASMPPLYSGLHMLTHNKPSVLYDARGTLTAGTYFPANVTRLSGDFVQESLDFMMEVNEENPDAVFGFVTGDARIYNAIGWPSYAGIDSSRVKITLFPDGSGTYGASYNTPFGPAISGGTNFKTHIQSLNEAFARQFTMEDFVEDPYTRSYTLPHPAATFPQVHYYIQDLAYLITNDPYVEAQKNLSNYIVKSPDKLLADLPYQKQQQFYQLTNFDKGTFETLFDASPKKNLVIIGTNTNTNASFPPEVQRAFVQMVMDQYGENFDVFFKPHPSDTDYNKEGSPYDEVFGLTLLPARMPFEIFCWALSDKMDAIGGTSSTVFLTVPLEKVNFMFAPNSSSLGIPLNTVLADSPNVNWMTLPVAE